MKFLMKSAVFWGIARRNTSEYGRFHQHRGGSLKSKKFHMYKISVSHKGDAEDSDLLACDAVSFGK
jgi:hypothetical protein